jgi:hypothetical protein
VPLECPSSAPRAPLERPLSAPRAPLLRLVREVDGNTHPIASEGGQLLREVCPMTTHCTVPPAGASMLALQRKGKALTVATQQRRATIREQR